MLDLLPHRAPPTLSAFATAPRFKVGNSTDDCRALIRCTTWFFHGLSRSAGKGILFALLSATMQRPAETKPPARLRRTVSGFARRLCMTHIGRPLRRRARTTTGCVARATRRTWADCKSRVAPRGVDRNDMMMETGLAASWSWSELRLSSGVTRHPLNRHSALDGRTPLEARLGDRGLGLATRRRSVKRSGVARLSAEWEPPLRRRNSLRFRFA